MFIIFIIMFITLLAHAFFIQTTVNIFLNLETVQ